MEINKNKTYIIAEIGGNFTDFEQAKKLIDAAKNCGVDAVKLQTYRADTITSSKAIFDMENTGIASQYELFDKYTIDEELHKEVFNYARSQKLDVFSTPSHISDVEMLERVGCDVYKIGSDDAVNIPYLKQVARIGKPIILATGMCTMSEVRKSVDAILEEGNSHLMLLHAITAYPTHLGDVNLRAMQAMIKEFSELKVGYSDHTIGTIAAIAAAAMGAKIIEKHFTYDKDAEGPDHMLSANPEEMKYIVESIRELEIIRGSGIKMPASGEKTTRINNRKSIVINRDLHKGDYIDQDAIEIKRPGYGIYPKYFEEILGRKVNKDLEKDCVLRWEDLS